MLAHCLALEQATVSASEYFYASTLTSLPPWMCLPYAWVNKDLNMDTLLNLHQYTLASCQSWYIQVDHFLLFQNIDVRSQYIWRTKHSLALFPSGSFRLVETYYNTLFPSSVCCNTK